MAGKETFEDKSILEIIPLATVISVGPEEKVVYLNPKFLQLFGYTLQDIPDVAAWWSLACPDEAYRKRVQEEWTARVSRAVKDKTGTGPMETEVVCKDGSRKTIEFRLVCLGEKNIIFGIDLTDRKQQESGQIKLTKSLELLWGLAAMQDKSTKDISDYVLEGIKKLSGSKYAFYGFINDAETEMTIFSWSKETMQECAMHDKPLVFSLAEAGIWADAVRKRKSIIVNDYDLGFEGKKGVPQGHVALTRVLSVPVFHKGKIVAVGAVANKATEYSQDDLAQLEAFLNNSQVIAERKKLEEEIQKRLKELETFYKASVGREERILALKQEVEQLRKELGKQR